MARPSDVRAPLVGEKHVGAPIEALCVTLQAPCARGQRCQIGIVGDDHKHVDVLGIRLGRHDRAQNGNAPDASNLSDSRNESAQSVEQLLTVTLGGRRSSSASIQRRNLAERHQDLDRTRPTRRSFDQATPFERENHVVN